MSEGVLMHQVTDGGENVTLLDALKRRRAAGNWQGVGALFRSLSTAQTLDALVALAIEDKPFVGVGFLIKEMKLDLFAGIGSDLGAWAQQTFRTWLARAKEWADAGQAWREQMPSALAGPVFLALARGKVPIAQECERFFPSAIETATVGPVTPARQALVRECARAIAPERLAATVAACMKANASPETALVVLEDHDNEAVARRFLEWDGVAWPAKKKIAALAPFAKHPGVAAALASFGKPGGAALVTTSVRTATDPLDEVTRAQIRVAAKAYDGKDRSLEQLLQEEEAPLLEIRTLAEGSKHVFDAILLGGDSATIFTAGTTREVASMIQGGVQHPDAPTARALTAALDMKVKKSATASKKTPPKKNPSKKAPPPKKKR